MATALRLIWSCDMLFLVNSDVAIVVAGGRCGDDHVARPEIDVDRLWRLRERCQPDLKVMKDVPTLYRARTRSKW